MLNRPEKLSLTDFHQDFLTTCVLPFVDSASLGLSWSVVSRNSASLFNSPDLWRQKLRGDFGIDINEDELLKMAKISRKEGVVYLYKRIYQKLHRLHQRAPGLSYLKSCTDDHSRHACLIACCVDDVSNLKLIPVDEYHYWFCVAANLGSVTVALEIFKKLTQPVMREQYINVVCLADNLPLLRALLDPKNKFNIRLDGSSKSTALNSAAWSGTANVALYLLDPANEFSVIHYFHTVLFAFESQNKALARHFLSEPSVSSSVAIRPAIKSGDLDFLQFVLARFKIGKKNISSIENLNLAAETGSLELVKYFLSDNEVVLKPNSGTLTSAAKSGNVELMKFLLVDCKVELSVDDCNLLFESAAKSQKGGLMMVKFLLQRYGDTYVPPTALKQAIDEGNFPLVQFYCNLGPAFKFLPPTEENLNNAVYTGNLPLVRYLLNPENRFGLIPTAKTLTYAGNTMNLPMLRFLLDPNNHLNLTPDEELNQRVSMTKADFNTPVLSTITQRLLPGAIALHAALAHLQRREYSAAEDLLGRSNLLSPSYFSQFSAYVLSHPAEFQLDKKGQRLFETYSQESQPDYHARNVVCIAKKP